MNARPLVRAAFGLSLAGCTSVPRDDAAASSPPTSCAGTSWSRSFGSDDEVPLAAAVVDAECNVVFAGVAHGPVDLGGGLEGDSYLHTVVVKLDAGGRYLWSRQFPGGAYVYSGKGLAVDAQGDVIFGGILEATVDLGAGSLTYGGNGMADDLFLAKLDRDGNPLWSKGFAGGIDPNLYDTRDILAIAAAPNGDVLLTGYYSGTIAFGGENQLPVVPDTSNIFLARFDAKGQFLSQKAYGGSDENRGGGLAFRPDGSFLLAGMCSPGTSLGGEALTGNASSVCLASYDPSGQQVWTRFFTSGGHTEVTGLALDAGGGIVLGGWGGDALIDFGGGALGATDTGFGFVARLDASGDHVWSRAIANASVQGIASTPGQGAVATGWFYGPTDAAGATLTSSGPDMSAFFLRLDAEGNHRSSATFGEGGQAAGKAVAVDPLGHAYLAGRFTGRIDLGQGPLEAPAPDSHSFAARLSE